MVVVNLRVTPDISPDLLAQLKRIPPATIGHVLEHEFMDNELRPLARRFSFCGPAVTVRCYGTDSSIVHYAVHLSR